MDTLPIALDRAALFLDFDGTLVEIAPRPDAVVVPPALPGLLRRLAARLEGALAIVSGRPLAELDSFLPVPLAMAGEHGAALRPAPGGRAQRPPLPLPPPEWRHRAEALAAAHPGALVEPKAHGFVLHYRQAPEAGQPGRALLEDLVGGDADFVVMPAHMAWEVKPAAVSKAMAVERLMAAPPFAGRLPVYVGDDVTDEAGMAAARAAGGLGLRLQDSFGTPAALRDWLARLAEGAPAEAVAR
ncbi:trehalose-phosphatase [Falsiroseomonas bella]|uniref:Trehalose 6-phosphate phosphatase n=1 Tax=Falsiroseomonas bella TaxID=2184016 RepID=A0A317FJF1_9PROT|nr:trehalose-phosphatase [Falsiroseomonas bella]PWS38079.1 trehalose-phosphatase [Falsiroseomonas bella]